MTDNKNNTWQQPLLDYLPMQFIPYPINSTPQYNYGQYRNYHYNPYHYYGKRKKGHGSSAKKKQSQNRSQPRAKKAKLSGKETDKTTCPWSEEAKEEERQKQVSDAASKLKSKLMMWNAERSEGQSGQETENACKDKSDKQGSSQSVISKSGPSKGKKKKKTKKAGLRQGTVTSQSKFRVAQLGSVNNQSEVRQKRIQENLIGELMSLPKENLNKVFVNPNIHPKIGIGMAQIVKENRLLLAQKFRKLAESKMNNQGQVLCSQLLDDISALINPDLAVDLSQLPPEFIRQMGDIFQLDFDREPGALTGDQECVNETTVSHHENSSTATENYEKPAAGVATTEGESPVMDDTAECDASSDVIYVEHEKPIPECYTIDDEGERMDPEEMPQDGLTRCGGEKFLFNFGSGECGDQETRTTADMCIGTSDEFPSSPLSTTVATQTCDEDLMTSPQSEIPKDTCSRGAEPSDWTSQRGGFHDRSSFAGGREAMPLESRTETISVSCQTHVNLIEVEKCKSLFGNKNSRETMRTIMNEIEMIDSIAHRLNQRRFFLFLKLSQLPSTSSLGNAMTDKLMRAVTYNDERVVREFARKRIDRK